VLGAAVDLGPDERTRPPLHGLVIFAALAGASLAAAVAGGLWRAGAAPPAAPPLWRSAGLAHGPLMLSAVFGSVIALERAVALKRSWAYAAPLAAGLGGIALLAGAPAAAAVLGLVAAALLLAVHLMLARRQPAPHTLLLAVAAAAWLGAQALFAAGGDAWRLWFLFPVLTVAAERLELTRLARRPAWATGLLAAVVALLLAASLASVALYGVALMALSAWLLVFDVAHRTVRARGLPRFIAVALLLGHAWLGVGGLAWLGVAYGCPGRDLALHAVGIGFLLGMVMAHAPVILPAVTGLRLRFSAAWYAPLMLLHASLLWRFSGALHDAALAHAAALLSFGIIVVLHRRA
jgi:hypothetical protein